MHVATPNSVRVSWIITACHHWHLSPVSRLAAGSQMTIFGCQPFAFFHHQKFPFFLLFFFVTIVFSSSFVPSILLCFLPSDTHLCIEAIITTILFERGFYRPTLLAIMPLSKMVFRLLGMIFSHNPPPPFLFILEECC